MATGFDVAGVHFAETWEQSLLRDSVRDFARRYLTNEYIDTCEEKQQPPEDVFQKAVELSWTGLAIPEEYGGSGGSIRDLMVVFEELAYGWRTFASLVYRSALHGSLSLLSYGTEEQKREFLPRLAAGTARFCFSLTEPHGGSDAANIRTRAVRDGDTYVINGSKVWNSGAHISDYILLVCRTADTGKKHEGLSMILVPTNSPGLTMKRIPTIIEQSIGANEVFYDDVRVPARLLLGQEGNGWKQAAMNLEKERLYQAVMSLGQARHAFDLTLNYTKERVVFGQPIGVHQVNQHRFADLSLMLYVGRLMVNDLATRIEAGQPARNEAAMAKIYLTDAYKAIVDYGVQMHGGYGVATEYPISRHYREAPVNRIAGGTTEVLKNLIAGQLGLRPR